MSCGVPYGAKSGSFHSNSQPLVARIGTPLEGGFLPSLNAPHLITVNGVARGRFTPKDSQLASHPCECGALGRAVALGLAPHRDRDAPIHHAVRHLADKRDYLRGPGGKSLDVVAIAYAAVPA